MNNAVKWGVIGGIGVILVDTLLYLVDPVNIMGGLSYVEWLVYIPVMIKAGIDDKNDAGGYMTWGEALKPTYLTFVIASLFYVVYMYAMYNIIDPGLADIQRDASMEMIEGMADFMGEEATEQMIAGMEGQEFGLTFGRAALTFGWRLLFPGFVFAAICSLIVRRNPPDDLALDN
ncbi:MAG: DUF4199 domain-containing protein [Bacteroidota bacterium]